MAKREKIKKEKKTVLKPKKEKHVLGKKEFIFNFISLVAMIGVGIYFGYRSLYYYSLQNRTFQEEAETLNGHIIQHTKIATGDDEGLHHDSTGYYYKGNIPNNYVLFGHHLYRVIRINEEDNSVRIISEDIVSSFPWGDTTNYKESNIYAWLVKGEKDFSGFYYDSIPNASKYLVKTTYQIEDMNEEQVVPRDEEYSDYVTMLTVTEYILANGMNSYLKDGKLFYLLGYSADGQNLYVEEDGSIQSCDSMQGFGIRPVITLKGNTAITGGDGTHDNPYVVALDKGSTYVDSYVKLGDDIWRVFNERYSVLRLSLNGYILENNAEKVTFYSQINSIYDIMDAENIGYYLNHAYFDSLPYRDKLVDFNSFTGEISDDQGYWYENTYRSMVTAKVGLLNIFDYKANTSLADYFHVNTTSQVGSMQYITYANGLLAEADVRDVKHIVPVIAISKESIKGGSGTATDPYVVG